MDRLSDTLPRLRSPGCPVATARRLSTRSPAASACRAEVLEQILMKTDGIPLFVEELTKTVLESGLLSDAGDHFELSGPLPPFAIPATLHDSLLARLDRLAPVKEVAQIGAVVGREFSYELLANVSAPAGARAPCFPRGAGSIRAGFLPRHPSGSNIQLQAMRSCRTPPTRVCSRARRQQLHARIAAVLEECFRKRLRRSPKFSPIICRRRDCTHSAVEYWRKAGEIAVRRSANVEAIAHFSRALEALVTQPDRRARSERELALQMALAVPLVATKGHSGIEVERTYSRAQALCEELGKQDVPFPVLRGLWNTYLGRGRLQDAHDLAVRISAQAEAHEGPLEIALAHRALGSTLFFLGRFAEALDQTGRAIAIDDSLQARTATARSCSSTASGRASSCAAVRGLGVVVPGVSRSSRRKFRRGARARREAGSRAHAGFRHGLRGRHAQRSARLRCGARIRQRDIPNRRQARPAGVVRRESRSQGLCRGEPRTPRGRHRSPAQRHLGPAPNRRFSPPESLAWPAGGCVSGGRRLSRCTGGARRGARVCRHDAGALLRARARSAARCSVDSARQNRRSRRLFSGSASRGGGYRSESRSNCAPRRALPDCGTSRAGVPKRYDLLAPLYGWFTEGLGTADLRDARRCSNSSGRHWRRRAAPAADLCRSSFA